MTLGRAALHSEGRKVEQTSFHMTARCHKSFDRSYFIVVRSR